MNRFKSIMLALFVVTVSFWAANSFADTVENSTTGVLGYDLVSYHTEGKPVRGDGAGVWSFIHVEDAAEATVAAIEQGDPGIYNIVDDDPSEVRVWLPALAKWLGAPPPSHLDEAQMDDPDFLYYFTRLRGASNAKAKNELGFQPRPLEWLQA